MAAARAEWEAESTSGGRKFRAVSLRMTWRKRRKKIVKEVGSGGVAPEEHERSTKKQENARPAARLVDLTN